MWKTSFRVLEVCCEHKRQEARKINSSWLWSIRNFVKNQLIPPVFNGSAGRVVNLKCEATFWKRTLLKNFKIKNITEPILNVRVTVTYFSYYRIDTEAVCVSDAEGVIFVCKHNDIWDRVDSESIVESPEHRTDIQRQRREVTLSEDGLYKLVRREDYLNCRYLCAVLM